MCCRRLRFAEKSVAKSLEKTTACVQSISFHHTTHQTRSCLRFSIALGLYRPLDVRQGDVVSCVLSPLRHPPTQERLLKSTLQARRNRRSSNHTSCILLDWNENSCAKSPSHQSEVEEDALLFKHKIRFHSSNSRINVSRKPERF